MNEVVKNDQGQLSGAKLLLMTAMVLAVGWSARDLISGRELTETHAALLGLLLFTGLINRVSARGRFRLRLGREGAEVETNGKEY